MHGKPVPYYGMFSQGGLLKSLYGEPAQYNLQPLYICIRDSTNAHLALPTSTCKKNIQNPNKYISISISGITWIIPDTYTYS